MSTRVSTNVRLHGNELLKILSSSETYSCGNNFAGRQMERCGQYHFTSGLAKSPWSDGINIVPTGRTRHRRHSFSPLLLYRRVRSINCGDRTVSLQDEGLHQVEYFPWERPAVAFYLKRLFKKLHQKSGKCDIFGVLVVDHPESRFSSIFRPYKLGCPNHHLT